MNWPRGLVALVTARCFGARVCRAISQVKGARGLSWSRGLVGECSELKNYTLMGRQWTWNKVSLVEIRPAVKILTVI